jgi:hypothetical protein
MNKLEHALHNEMACNHLLACGQFNDWVITTAFYSALHFSHYELFPGTYNDVYHADFDSYFRAIPKRKMTKHAAILQLTGRHLTYHQQYSWLYSNCMSARYCDYQVSNGKAAHARQLLDSIKSSLTKSV